MIDLPPRTHPDWPPIPRWADYGACLLICFLVIIDIAISFIFYGDHYGGKR